MEKIDRKRNRIIRKIQGYRFLLVALFIFLAILITIFVSRVIGYNSAENEVKSVLELISQIQETDSENPEVEVKNAKMKGYNVIGSIKIESIGLEYPILEVTNEETLNLSITKLSGPDLNQNGNVSLAGHNNRNGTLFSKLPNVNNDDTIEITDMKGNTVKYKVNKIYIVEPTDTSCADTNDENSKELTLITCTLGNAKRLIIKANELI